MIAILLYFDIFKSFPETKRRGFFTRGAVFSRTSMVIAYPYDNLSLSYPYPKYPVPFLYLSLLYLWVSYASYIWPKYPIPVLNTLYLLYISHNLSPSLLYLSYPIPMAILRSHLHACSLFSFMFPLIPFILFEKSFRVFLPKCSYTSFKLQTLTR